MASTIAPWPARSTSSASAGPSCCCATCCCTARGAFRTSTASLPGVAPNTLSARLKALEDSGLVSRVLYNERPPRLEYVLTAKGKSLGPIVKAMREWGSKHLA